jgi:hypothetical protein
MDGKNDKVSVGWRLPKPLIDKATQEAKTMGLSLPAFITMILAMRYSESK